VNEWFSLFFISYKCSIGLAVVQVILSVFIQQTFKVAAQDENIMINERKAQGAAIVRNLEHLFDVLDKSGDGLIDRVEFEILKHDPVVKFWLSALEVDTSDVDQLLDDLDDGDQLISRKEFIDGIKAIRGQAKKTDILEMKRQLKIIDSKIEDLPKSRGMGLTPILEKSIIRLTANV